MEERTGREQFPGEIVETYRQPDPQEVVETYRRPLPKRMAPPRPPAGAAGGGKRES